MNIYENARAAVVKSLAKFGVPARFTRMEVGDYVPGSDPVETEVNFDADVIKKDYAQKDIDGTLIKQFDQLLLVSPEAKYAPETGDKVTLPDGVWTVIKGGTKQPADIVISYWAQIRK